MSEISRLPVALALGSNIGDRLAHLRAAVMALAAHIVLSDVSSAYETAPAFYTDQPRFLNAALVGTTDLEPHALLRWIKSVEADIGRAPTFRNGPRIIDIDILLYGDQIIENAELTIPHRGLPERDFVLYPLSDIASAWVHPVLKQSIGSIKCALAPSAATVFEAVI